MAELHTRPANHLPERSAAEVPPATDQERSIAQLVSGLVADAQNLARKEMALARAEIMGEIRKSRQGAIGLGIGAALAFIGSLFLTAMVVDLLVEFADMERWLANLIVGGIYAIVGGVSLYFGIKRFQTVDPVPRETIDSVREDVAWLKEQTPSGKT